MVAVESRPWYRLHWATWLVLLTVGFGIAFIELAEYPTLFRWPFLVGAAWPASWPGHYIVDFLLPFAVLTATAFVVERVRESWERHQLRLSTLFGGIAVMAVLLGRWQFEERRFASWIATAPQPEDLIFWRGKLVVVVTKYPWFAEIPMLIGVACTIYTAGWLVARATSRLYKLAVGAER